MGRLALLAIALLWTVGADAAVPLPDPPAGKGGQCVAPTEIMCRDHPELLNHQRDETVRNGIRTRRFSLKECVACHAVAGSDGKPVGYDDPKYFCRECHDYAAVRIDCFECHASKPDAPVAMLSSTFRRWCNG